MILGYNEKIIDTWCDGWENEFKLAMIVPGFAYYANYEESDDNGNTIVMNENHEILSNNIFATNSFIEELEKVNAGKLQPLFISDEMQEHFKLLQEAGYFDE